MRSSRNALPPQPVRPQTHAPHIKPSFAVSVDVPPPFALSLKLRPFPQPALCNPHSSSPLAGQAVCAFARWLLSVSRFPSVLSPRSLLVFRLPPFRVAPAQPSLPIAAPPPAITIQRSGLSRLASTPSLWSQSAICIRQPCPSLPPSAFPPRSAIPSVPLLPFQPNKHPTPAEPAQGRWQRPKLVALLLPRLSIHEKGRFSAHLRHSSSDNY